MKKSIFTLLLCLAAGTLSAQERIILLNEGLWQSDNGRVTYFEEDRVVSNQWFLDRNGSKLGDTPDDIIQVSDQLIAIAVNGSGIVQFIRPDGTAVAATGDIPNNRKLCTDGRYVYVTSYAHECVTGQGVQTFEKGYVAKIDAATFKVVAATEVGYEPEGIAYYGGRLFVANTGGYSFQGDHDYETTVSIVNAGTMQVERTIDTGQPNLYSKLSQSGKYLCIGSPGDYYTVAPACIIMDCEEAMQGAGSDCFVSLGCVANFSSTMSDGRFLALGTRFSYSDGESAAVCEASVIDPREVLATQGRSGVSQDLPGSLLPDLLARQPCGVFVNPYTGYVYATDAESYASAGTLSQWSPDGALLGRHKVYINPAHFLALPPDGQHFTGIAEVRREAPAAAADTDGAVQYYGVDGVSLPHARKGLNLLRKADGTVRKVVRP